MQRPSEEIGSEQVAWYCARTQPKHEHIAAAGLRNRLGLEVFNPRLRMERATRRGVTTVVEPLFPCYLFVRCRLEVELNQVCYVNGVAGLVRFGEEIPVVPDEVVAELQRCFESTEPLRVEERLEAGTEVTVAEGPLLGARGVVLRSLSAKQRVQILLEFLGRSSLVEVDRNALIVENRRVAALVPLLAQSLPAAPGQ